MNSAANTEKKYFTPAQANQTLPLVRAIVEDIVRNYADISERQDRLARIRKAPGSGTADEQTPYSEELEQIEKELEKDAGKLSEYVDELAAFGAELKDPAIGLVDFPGLMQEREVCLCWKLGEPEIGYWHEVDAGFQGRQALLSTSKSDKPDATVE